MTQPPWRRRLIWNKQIVSSEKSFQTKSVVLKADKREFHYDMLVTHLSDLRIFKTDLNCRKTTWDCLILILQNVGQVITDLPVSSAVCVWTMLLAIRWMDPASAPPDGWDLLVIQVRSPIDNKVLEESYLPVMQIVRMLSLRWMCIVDLCDGANFSCWCCFDGAYLIWRHCSKQVFHGLNSFSSLSIIVQPS